MRKRYLLFNFIEKKLLNFFSKHPLLIRKPSSLSLRKNKNKSTKEKELG